MITVDTVPPPLDGTLVRSIAYCVQTWWNRNIEIGCSNKEVCCSKWHFNQSLKELTFVLRPVRRTQRIVGVYRPIEQRFTNCGLRRKINDRNILMGIKNLSDPLKYYYQREMKVWRTAIPVCLATISTAKLTTCPVEYLWTRSSLSSNCFRISEV